MKSLAKAAKEAKSISVVAQLGAPSIDRLGRTNPAVGRAMPGVPFFRETEHYFDFRWVDLLRWLLLFCVAWERFRSKQFCYSHSMSLLPDFPRLCQKWN